MSIDGEERVEEEEQLKFTKLIPCEMSDFQTTWYLNIFRQIKGKGKIKAELNEDEQLEIEEDVANLEEGPAAEEAEETEEAEAFSSSLSLNSSSSDSLS
jgi:hypothetical protein